MRTRTITQMKLVEASTPTELMYKFNEMMDDVTNNWWNAALYNHNTGQPYAALYELKAFVKNPAGIGSATVKHMSRDPYWYTLQGTRLDSRPQRQGLYITGGKKVFVK